MILWPVFTNLWPILLDHHKGPLFKEWFPNSVSELYRQKQNFQKISITLFGQCYFSFFRPASHELAPTATPLYWVVVNGGKKLPSWFGWFSLLASLFNRRWQTQFCENCFERVADRTAREWHHSSPSSWPTYKHHHISFQKSLAWSRSRATSLQNCKTGEACLQEKQWKNMYFGVRTLCATLLLLLLVVVLECTECLLGTHIYVESFM